MLLILMLATIIKPMRICLLTFCILSVFTSTAQKPYIVKLDAPSDTVQWDRNFYVDDIIDNRSIKDNIGSVLKGMGNKEFPVKFPQEFKTYLDNFLKDYIPKVESQQPIILRVNQLEVAEKALFSTVIGTANIKLDVLIKIDDEFYLYGSYEAMREKEGLSGIRSKHDDRIIECIVDCLKQFLNSRTEIQSNLVKIDSSNLVIKYDFDFSLGMKSGGYLSYEDLINKSVIDTVQFELSEPTKREGFERYLIYESSSKKLLKDYFGYSDGKEIFINAANYSFGNYFVKSRLIGRYIYFQDIVSPPGIEIGYLYGAIGSAIVGGATKRRGIVLDAETGITHILTQNKLEYILSEHPTLLYEYKNGKKKIEDIYVIVNKLNKLLTNKR